MLNRLLLALGLLVAIPARAEDAAIDHLFRSAGVDGTIVIESLSSGKRVVHNELRAQQRYPAASTFKVLNTLIALEEGAISGEDAIFHWKVSCVWCYQQLARRIGALKYPAYIQRSNYGQLREPFNGTQFWLDGSLKISAEEQVAFLRQVVERKLPFKTSSYDVLKKIMLSDETARYRLYAKTGWATGSPPSVGWYVGYVEANDEVWVFALNLATRDATDLPLRIQIAEDALETVRALPLK